MARPGAAHSLAILFLATYAFSSAMAQAGTPKNKAPDPAWKLFVEAVTNRGLKTLAISESASLNILARQMQTDLEEMREKGEKGRKGSDFPVKYSVVVWRRGIRRRDYGSVVVPGETQFVQASGYGVVKHPVRDGIRPFPCCDRRYQTFPEGIFQDSIGEFGWPCQRGGSVAAKTGNTVSLIFFRPLGPDPAIDLEEPPDPPDQAKGAEPESVGWLVSTIGYCLVMQPRGRDFNSDVKFDLTAMSTCISDQYPYVEPRKEGPRPFKAKRRKTRIMMCLKGVAVFPGRPEDGVRDPLLFGMASEHGGVVMQHVRLPMPPPPPFDLNDPAPEEPPELHLTVVTAIDLKD